MNDTTRCDDPLRTAAVGMHFGAGESARLRDDAHMELVKVCDLREDRARRASDKLGVPYTLELGEILADDTIEAVALFVQPAGRGRLIRTVAQAGKHLITTKPFERSVSEAVAAHEAVERTGVAAMVNSPPPFYVGGYAPVREAIASGRLPVVTTASAFVWGNYGPTEPDGSWYDDPEACPAAPIYRLGIYAINFFNVFLGRPVSVTVQEGRIQTRRPTSDIAVATIQYESGAIASITASLSVGGPPYPNALQLAGPAGVLQLNPTLSGFDLYWHDSDGTQKHPSVRDVFAGYDYAGFYRMVRAGVRPEIGLERSIDGVRVMEGIARAGRERRTVEL